LGTTGAASGLGAEGGGGQIHGPKHHQGGVRVDVLGSENPVELDLVPGKIARGLGNAEAEGEGAATGAGHVVEARLGVEVMATAGAAADGGLCRQRRPLSRVWRQVGMIKAHEFIEPPRGAKFRVGSSARELEGKSGGRRYEDNPKWETMRK
jgi:hypothetical protein